MLTNRKPHRSTSRLNWLRKHNFLACEVKFYQKYKKMHWKIIIEAGKTRAQIFRSRTVRRKKKMLVSVRLGFFLTANCPIAKNPRVGKTTTIKLLSERLARVPIGEPRETPRTSQHYGTEGFKGALIWNPTMPRRDPIGQPQ